MIQLERTYKGTLQELWDLWTTKDGIESWWGPEGFRVEVRKLDLRDGGELRYAMIANAPEQIAFMKNAGMPTSTETRLSYKKVEPLRRLELVNHADFIPGVKPYDVGTVVEFAQAAGGVKLTLQLEPMHDEVWTGRMKMGWEQELGKLEKRLAAA